jgi:thioredoxin 1
MGVQQIAGSEFQSTVEQSDTPVVIDFFATWCGPCRLIAPALEELSGTYDGKVKFVKVDIDQAPEVAEKFAVTGVPTLVIVKGGQEADRKVGAFPKPTLASWIAEHAG